MKILELKGYKSYMAFTAFHRLMLGLKMIPEYKLIGYEEFFNAVHKLTEPEQREMIKKASIFVTLERDEMESLISFGVDPNGVPYSKENIRDMSPDQMIDIVIAVCMEIAKIKIDFVTDAEKKNLKTGHSTSDRCLPATPE